MASGFVRRDGEDLIVHEWEQYNASLFANWTNGKKGGRPRSTEKKKPKENPRETHGIPMANPWRTDKIGVDRIGVDKIGEDKDPPPRAREAAGEEDGPPKAVTLPTREEVLAFAHTAGVPADVAGVWFDETDARAVSADGHWTDKSGRPIAKWQSALKAYAAKWASNEAQRAARPVAAGAKTKRGASVWELQQRIEAAQKEIDRISANPANKEQIPDSFDRRLKSEPAAQVKSLKARISEMRAELAGVERKEAA